MICQNCKNEIPDHSNFCIHCGHPQKQSGSYISGKTSNKHFIIFVIAVLAIATTVVFFTMDEHTLENPADAQTTSGLAIQLENLLEQEKNDPDNLQIQTALGHAFFDIGKFGKALNYYKKVLQRQPDNVEVIIDAGVCYFNQDNLEQAEANFVKALAIDPSHAVGLYNMGIVYSKKGLNEQAAKYWHKILQVAPDSPQADLIRKIKEQMNLQTPKEQPNGQR
jgi:tetratricopeptide (TPR) repeat protein